MEQLENIYKNQTKDIVKYIDGKYKLNSRYKIGKIILSNNNAILEMKDRESQKIFIDLDQLNGAYHNDIVVTQVIFHPKGKTKAKVIDVLESANNKILVYKRDNSIYTVKEHLCLTNVKFELNDNDVAVVEKNSLVKIIGNIKDPKIDEKISLYLYGEEYRLNSYSTVDIEQPKQTNRIDLTHLDFCTIDPATAKDHDDAIYFDEENSELYVAIADVSSYVQEGSSLDKEAYKRAFSIYLPTKVLPMLPFELSADLCSLVPNKHRNSFVFQMKLDVSKTKVVSSKLFEAIIESKNKYSYEYIDEVLEKEDQSNYFTKLYNITKRFRKSRLKKGFDFRSEEIRLKLDDDENYKSYSLEISSPSHSLVEECMLLANQEAAKKLKRYGIFRVHEEPSTTKIKKLLDDINELGIKAKLKEDIHSTILEVQKQSRLVGLEAEIDQLIIQSQQQAYYSNIKNEHFGLGFSNYSHFTSPIRRYSDLVLHRILKTKNIPENIEEICEKISDTERKINNLVWDYEDRKYARYLDKNIGKNYIGKIVDTDNGIVKLDDRKIKGARVYVENYSGEKLFTKVEIKITKSDIISKKVIGSIIGLVKD